jgi:hypothetical protein
MVRPVCQKCHGIGFSLAAMAEPELARQNFRRAPRVRARALDMVREKGSKAKRSPTAKEDRR